MATKGGPNRFKNNENLIFYLDSDDIISMSDITGVSYDLVNNNVLTHYNGVSKIYNSNSRYLNYDGVNDQTRFNFPSTINNKITISGHIKKIGGGTIGTILHSGVDQFYLQTYGDRLQTYWTGTSGGYKKSSPFEHQDVFFTVVWNTTEGYCSYYERGNLLNIVNFTPSTSPDINIGNETQIGMQGTDPQGTYARLFNGNINYLKIWDKVLTPTEIRDDYLQYKGRIGL